MSMMPVIYSVACWDHPNIRTWEPDAPDDIAEELVLDIGAKGKKGADSFTLRVATPKGLERLPARNNIIATRPLLVMDRYDFDSLWAWLQTTVAACEGDTWLDCVNELRVHFLWEYEGMEHD
jgi:hypothetical protein